MRRATDSGSGTVEARRDCKITRVRPRDNSIGNDTPFQPNAHFSVSKVGKVDVPRSNHIMSNNHVRYSLFTWYSFAQAHILSMPGPRSSTGKDGSRSTEVGLE